MMFDRVTPLGPSSIHAAGGARANGLSMLTHAPQNVVIGSSERNRRAKFIGRNADPHWLSDPLAEVHLHASSTRPHALARIGGPMLHAP